ncbi:Predicted Zn-dependent hydrolases of the beta-lactamase fold [Alteromonadaceae bacterium Bs31]|nr:Predicted Zn-dependent hydrolases of the beta-lactamase fold [Alteromonadaceae bacterium Bs31]
MYALATEQLKQRLLIRLALVVLTLTSTGCSTTHIVYLGSAGYLIDSADSKVIIDAPYSDYVARFEVPVADKPIISALKTATKPFNNIQLILISHSHPGHFDAALLAEHLMSSPDTVLVANGTVVDQVLKHVDSALNITNQIRLVSIEQDFESTELIASGLPLTVTRFPHWVRENSDDEGYVYSYQFAIGGFEYLYLLSPDSYVAPSPVDVAFSAEPLNAITPQHLVLIHKNGKEQIATLSRQVSALQHVSFLTEAMESINLRKNLLGKVSRVEQ